MMIIGGNLQDGLGQMNKDKINEVFTKKFGKTPLDERISDILKQANNLSRFQNVKDLRKYTGNLLASVIQLCNENDINPEEVVNNSLELITNESFFYESLGRKKRIAILGGAFDPVTLGHIRTAQFVLNESRWADEVWMMPAYAHMYGKKMVSPDHRMNMLHRAVMADRRIKANSFEIDLKLSGETYKTSKALAEQYPEYDFAFIIGLDNANTIEKWVNSEYLIAHSTFIVVPRVGIERNNQINWFNNKPHISLMHYDPHSYIGNISSSMYKHRRVDGQDVSDIMDKTVMEYIASHNLYSI